MLNRAELIRSTAAETGLTQAETRAVIDAFLGSILEEVAGGGDVKLSGFGVFRAVVHSQQTFTPVSNPDGQITLPPRRGMTFKASRLVRSDLARQPLTKVNGRRAH